MATYKVQMLDRNLAPHDVASFKRLFDACVMRDKLNDQARANGTFDVQSYRVLVIR